MCGKLTENRGRLPKVAANCLAWEPASTRGRRLVPQREHKAAPPGGQLLPCEERFLGKPGA